MRPGELRGGRLRAGGALDFRGTLGVDREAPVGFPTIHLYYDLDTDAAAEEPARLRALTARCGVVDRTLRDPPPVIVARGREASTARRRFRATMAASGGSDRRSEGR
jgi:hypothetical protein